MRRSACLSVALAVLMSLVVASAGTAGATPDPGGVSMPVARGEDPGTEDSDKEKSDKAKKAQKEDCPQDLWVVAVPIEGLACVLLLPKPPPEDGEEGGSGGLGGLF